MVQFSTYVLNSDFLVEQDYVVGYFMAGGVSADRTSLAASLTFTT